MVADRTEQQQAGQNGTGQAAQPGPNPVSTPEAASEHSGSDHATQGANTNLDASVQGGPVTQQDRAAAQVIQDQHAGSEQQGHAPPDGAAKIKGT